MAAITTSLVCLFSVTLWEVLTGRTAYVSCFCNFYDAVDLSGTSNALYLCFPVTLVLSVSALSPVAVCCPPDAARTAGSFCWRCPKLCTTLHTLRGSSVH